ncbi:uncharacterized protein [Spinacia oleracea]|uniref:Uncharacterized protein isoform X2 n=1 Tax=Spinacia oleracea TaxID=3562 RepID=A0ABM3QT95_SPIOL|nr:uncharacterized protein LOC110785704 isoform X2 [Spinacia oleracea]
MICSETGNMIILRRTTKITHKALATIALSAKWHVCATIHSFVTSKTELLETHNIPHAGVFDPKSLFSDSDDLRYDEEAVDNTKFLPAYTCGTISFQKRHALTLSTVRNGERGANG